MVDESGQIDEPKKVEGEKPRGLLKRWQLEIDAALETEREWRREASEILRLFARDGKKSWYGSSMLYANTQTIVPAIYSHTAKPDVRRRYRDPDQLGKQVSRGAERALSYCADTYPFDETVAMIVQDCVLTGRGVGRIEYEPEVEEVEGPDGGKAKTIIDQKVVLKRVHPFDFLQQPGLSDCGVMWRAYRHRLTRAQLVDRFGAKGDKVSLTLSPRLGGDGVDSKALDAVKRAEVWEIWDKVERRVIWISDGYKDGVLDESADVLDLEGFFPSPAPIQFIRDPDSLVPIPEYRHWRDEAEEVDALSRRIRHVVKAIKAKGIYDRSLGDDIERALKMEGDNTFIASESSTLALQSGGIDKAIWFMPVERIVVVLRELIAARADATQRLYEISGVSDIIRGVTDPNETLGAQRIKANFGSLRIDARRAEVQRFIRNVYRIMIEVICAHYEAPQLSMMTGMDITDDVLAVLRSDKLRGYKVDIETDSTVARDLEEEQALVTEFMREAGGYISGVAPLVAQGIVPKGVAVGLLLTAARRTRIGREFEGLLEELVDSDDGAGAKPGANPAAEAEMQVQQMDAQVKQVEAQIKIQTLQQEAALKADELRLKQQELALKSYALQVKAQEEALRLAAARADAETKGVVVGGGDISMPPMVTQDIAGAIRELVLEQKKELGAIMTSMQAVAAMMADAARTISAPRVLLRDQAGRPAGSMPMTRESMQ